MIVETVDGNVRARPGSAEHPDAVLEGPPDVVIAALRGSLAIAEAERRGLRVDGNPTVIRRPQPAPPN